MSEQIPHEALRQWAATKPTIKALYVFGSRARGDGQPDSDIDLAFELTDVDEADAELICNAAAWKAEVRQVTGIVVKDVYHRNSKPVMAGPVVQVFP